MKLVMFLIVCFSCKERQACENPETQFFYKGKCREITGIAAEFPKLIPNTLNLANQMWSDLDEYAEFPRKTYKHLRSFGEKFEQALKVESWKKSNGKKNCLKKVTQAKIDAVRAIARDDRSPWGHEQHVDLGEHLLENMLHLAFDVDCKIRRKLNNRLDKALFGVEQTCREWCSYFAYDYFFFYKTNGNPDDYFQAYYSGRHDEKAKLLEEPIYYLD